MSNEEYCGGVEVYRWPGDSNQDGDGNGDGRMAAETRTQVKDSMGKKTPYTTMQTITNFVYNIVHFVTTIFKLIF